MAESTANAKEPLIEFDFNNVMNDHLGRDAGLDRKDIDDLKGVIGEAHKDMMNRRKEGKLPFLDIPAQIKALRKLKRSADDIRKRIDNFVVLGIGGSALGARAIFKALRPLNQNLLEKSKRRFPRLFVADNVDPEGINSLLNLVDPRHTVFNIVSKSGTTTETMSQFFVVYDQIRRSLGRSSLKDHIIVSTDPQEGVLKKVSDQMGFETFDILPGLGGRFSVLTSVSLMPLAVAGVNVAELLRGANQAAEICTRQNLWNNPAYLFAAVAYALRMNKGRTIMVMMPYAEALSEVVDWFSLLWAESLGKTLTMDGRQIQAGQTPVKALGVTDQHSQIQLYMEGPQDKVIVFLGVKNFRTDVKIPTLFKEQDDLKYLGGHTLGQLVRIELAATARALAMSERPNMTLTMPKITPASIGYLLYLLEVAAITSGYLYQVNPMDQPGVEMGRNLVYGLMGRPGFESFKNEFNKGATPKKKYIIGY